MPALGFGLVTQERLYPPQDHQNAVLWDSGKMQCEEQEGTFGYFRHRESYFCSFHVPYLWDW